MGLVAEIHANHSGVPLVASREHGPVGDPGLFGVVGGVPEAACLGAVASLGTVVVENDAEAELAGSRDNAIEDLHGVEPLEIAVDWFVLRGTVADSLRDLRSFDHLVRQRDTDGVIALRFDCAQDVAIVLQGEAAGNAAARFETAPVDAGDADFPLIVVQDAVPVGVPIPVVVGQDRREFGGGQGGVPEHAHPLRRRCRTGGNQQRQNERDAGQAKERETPGALEKAKKEGGAHFRLLRTTVGRQSMGVRAVERLSAYGPPCCFVRWDAN